MWGHAVLLAVSLIKLRPSSVEIASSQELLSRHVPNVSHLRVFRSYVWVPLRELQRHTIDAHRQEGIYVGFDSPSNIRYINPFTDTLLRACFVNYRFKQDIFSSLKGRAST